MEWLPFSIIHCSHSHRHQVQICVPSMVCMVGSQERVARKEVAVEAAAVPQVAAEVASQAVREREHA